MIRPNKEDDVKRRRVVVTGLGLIGPTGNNVSDAWENIKNGVSGIRELTRYDKELAAIAVAGEVADFNPSDYLDRKDAQRTDRVTQFAVIASREALKDSGFEVNDENRYEIGVSIGSGIGGIESLVDANNTFNTKGYRRVSALAIPKILIDSSAGKVSMDLGLCGPNFNITTACATGNNSIGEAAEIIRRGQAKVMLAGATEAAIVPLTMAGFGNMKALTGQTNPATASKPFDAERDGFVPGEGAATLVLEDLDHALERGAHIYGEIVGYGHTSDAYHPTAPKANGEGAAMAMTFALRDAELETSDIDYINAHGTGTSLNDAAETRAIKTALGDDAYNVPISSTKSMTGHLLGASAALEAIFGLLAIRDNFVPPTLNLNTPDPECDLDYIPNQGREHQVDVVMSNSFGFGGHNAVLILQRYTD